MSARRRRRLALSDDATLDFEDVLLYTQERWGADQRRRYRTRLFQAMRSLLDHPELGRSHDELFPGYRSLVVEQHVVYCRIEDEAIAVGRILHSSQDPTGKVTP
jgi:toxin ParE1/3/4